MITKAITAGLIAVLGIAPVILVVTLTILTIALLIRKAQVVFA